MQGIYLKLYMPESQKHHGELLFEWMLETAKKLGIQGGSAFRAIAGYGRHGAIHEQTFFELAGELPVEVVFMTTEELADRLLETLRKEKLKLFYIKSPAEYGVLES